VRRISTILIVILIGAAAFAIFLVTAFVALRHAAGTQAPGLPPANNWFSITDTLSVWMGVLSVMIALSSLIVTGVGLVMGILALFGYQTFEKEVGRQVALAATAFFDGSAFDNKLGSKVKENITARTWTVQGSTATESGGGIPDLRIKRYPGKRKAKADGDIDPSGETNN
jgi:hypothetical protein